MSIFTFTVRTNNHQGLVKSASACTQTTHKSVKSNGSKKKSCKQLLILNLTPIYCCLVLQLSPSIFIRLTGVSVCKGAIAAYKVKVKYLFASWQTFILFVWLHDEDEMTVWLVSACVCVCICVRTVSSLTYEHAVYKHQHHFHHLLH